MSLYSLTYNSYEGFDLHFSPFKILHLEFPNVVVFPDLQHVEGIWLTLWPLNLAVWWDFWDFVFCCCVRVKYRDKTERTVQKQ